MVKLLTVGSFTIIHFDPTYGRVPERLGSGLYYAASKVHLDRSSRIIFSNRMRCLVPVHVHIGREMPSSSGLI